MNTTLATAAAALLLAASVFAAPASAAEEYQSGPALVLSARVPAFDTGSDQAPRFDGQAASGQPLQLMQTNGSEGSVETLASQTVPIGTYNASIGLLAQR